MSNLDDLVPDFEDMALISSTSASARLELHQVKNELESYIAECVRQAYQNPEFWINGKPGVQTYMDRVVAVVGNTPGDKEHIRNLTQRYLELQKEVDEARNLLQTMRDQLAAFQTISSNQRSGLVK